MYKKHKHGHEHEIKKNKRANEHKPNPRINPQKSSYAQHLMDESHSSGKIENNLEIVQISNKGFILDTLEEYHIYRAIKQNSNLVLNDKLNYSSHLIFNKIIENQIRWTSPPGQTPHPSRTSPRTQVQRSADTNFHHRRPPECSAGSRDGV